MWAGVGAREQSEREVAAEVGRAGKAKKAEPVADYMEDKTGKKKSRLLWTLDGNP